VRLPADPKLASDNAAVQQHMATYGWKLEGLTAAFSIGYADSRPVYFASPSDPVMTIVCTEEEGPNTCQGANKVNINGARIHVPAGAKPGNNWDSHMTIVETDTGQEYDMWRTTVSGSTITTWLGSMSNTSTSTGLGEEGDAADFALTAGLLRPSELASGQINHALVIDLPCTDGHGRTVGYAWPATGGWGEACGDYWNETPTGAPTIGQLFKLDMTDAQIAASGAPRWEQTIMTALAHYGAYAEDTNGSWRDENIHIFTQDPASWTNLGQADQWASTINALGGHGDTLTSPIPIPTNKLQTIDPCIPQGTCPGWSRRTRDRKRGSIRHGKLARRRKHHTRRHHTRGARR
jgi:hypothetical protein